MTDGEIQHSGSRPSASNSLRCRQHGAAGPGAGGVQLGLDPDGQRRGSGAVGDIQRLAEQLAAHGAAAAAAKPGTEVAHRTGSVQARSGAAEGGDRLAQQLLAAGVDCPLLR